MYQNLELLNKVVVLLHDVNLHLIAVQKKILTYMKHLMDIKQDASYMRRRRWITDAEAVIES